MLKININDLDPEQEINEYGVDSIAMLTLVNSINKHYQLSLMPTGLLEYPTLMSFTEYLVRDYRAELEKHYELTKLLATDAPIPESQLPGRLFF